MAGNVTIATNASGAAQAGKRSDVVVIVDVISMSTSAEALLEAGALAVFGASPDTTRAPVKVNPEKMGYIAGNFAQEKQTEVILVAEPRIGSDAERLRFSQKAYNGVQKSGNDIEGIIPNIGAETPKILDVKGKVILLVSDTGGVAFDAAWEAGAADVITGTIARTLGKKGEEPARCAAERAIQAATEKNANITIVAASGNSLEDVLAAEYIGRLILMRGFSKL